MTIYSGLYSLLTSTKSIAECQRYLTHPELARAIEKIFKKYTRVEHQSLIDYIYSLVNESNTTCHKPGVELGMPSCTGKIMLLTGDCSICVLGEKYFLELEKYYSERILPHVNSYQDLYLPDHTVALWLSVL